MNGVHDMGGMHGLGPVVREENEPVFHHDWERRTFALGLAAGRLRRWNLDMFRYARELMPPAEYLAASYYERGLHALERLLVERGILAREEIARRMREPRGAPAWRRRLARLGVRGRLFASRVLGAPGIAAPGQIPPARFRPGDLVIARNLTPRGHTRMPRLVRAGGVVDRDHGVFVFPDGAGEAAAALLQRPLHRPGSVGQGRFPARRRIRRPLRGVPRSGMTPAEGPGRAFGHVARAFREDVDFRRRAPGRAADCWPAEA